MKPMTLELRVDANGEVGEPVRTSDGEVDLFIHGFLVLTLGLEEGASATLTVARVSEGKQP